MQRTEGLRAIVFRTAAFRMALWQAALFAVLAAALLGIVWLRINDYAQEQLRDDVAIEMASLRQADARDNLEAELRQRLAGLPADQDYYLLTDAGGRAIAGNLSYRPASAGWHAVPLHGAVGKDNSDADQVQLFAARLADGRWLVVGRDNRSVVELGEVLSRGFIDIGLLAVVLVLLSGGFASWRYLQRIDALGERAERMLEGAPESRIVGSGRGDEIDRLAARLNRMLERMRVLMEGMRQVSDDIAHDLRTPLSKVRQQLEASLADTSDEAMLRRSVDRAIADIDGLLVTFRALLRIASVEARERQAGFGEVDLSAVFEHIAETYRPVAEDGNRRLEASVAPGQRMRGDRALITQMLANLVENALRHTPHDAHIRVDLQAGAGALVGRIADTGPGIPAESRERVLKRFVRLDSSRSTPGAGLGLALVAAVSDLHGIKLTLRDAAPGLVVELRFPDTAPR